jgi:UDP-glucuronate 4-epimerase
MKVLVTGAAGFIGYHVSKRLADTQSCEVLGVDSLNDYYSVDLKRARLAQLEGHDNFRFVQADFADAVAFSGIYNQFKPDYVVHLGAQANVRYSVDNPGDYVQSNLIGFFNVLEAARANPPKHLVFASSSSVYGETAKTPFDEDDDTKKAGEVMAHSYAHLHGLSLTGLRFFNVYGPWGRPDTAPTLFAQAINEGGSLDLYAEGKQLRDFTYIDDIVDGVLKTLLYPPAEPPIPPFRIFNIGHHRPMEVILFVRMLEQLMGKEAQLNLLPAQAADVPETCASLDKVNAAIGYTPKIPLEDGLKQFVDWFKSYY